MPEIVLWGGTGHAKVLHEAFWGTNVRLVAVFDNRPIDSPVAGVPLLVGEHAFERFVSRYSERSSLLFAVAIGGTKGRDRLHLFSYMTAHGLTPLTVKHRTAFVAVDTQI